MIIGNGMIANAFKSRYLDDDDVLIFASGVSNSLETADKEFEREQRLLSKTISDNKEKLLVYFSTISINDPTRKDDLYQRHKLSMENLVANSDHYLILRLPNVIGEGGNKNTLINYFVRRIVNNQHLEIWKNAYRNIIDLQDVVKITADLICKDTFNRKVRLTNPNSYKVTYIVKKIENFLECEADKTIIQKGEFYDTSPSEVVLKSIDTLNLDFNKNYLENILKEYYTKYTLSIGKAN